jgi:CO/xanthine dehydrogenase FAD-binding subunit
MRRFEMFEPKSIEEACKILPEHEDVKVIAGGTALLILIKHGVLVPKTLINLKKLKARRTSHLTQKAACELEV